MKHATKCTLHNITAIYVPCTRKITVQTDWLIITSYRMRLCRYSEQWFMIAEVFNSYCFLLLSDLLRVSCSMSDCVICNLRSIRYCLMYCLMYCLLYSARDFLPILLSAILVMWNAILYKHTTGVLPTATYWLKPGRSSSRIRFVLSYLPPSPHRAHTLCINSASQGYRSDVTVLHWIFVNGIPTSGKTYTCQQTRVSQLLRSQIEVSGAWWIEKTVISSVVETAWRLRVL